MQSSDGDVSPSKRRRIAQECQTTTKKGAKKFLFPQESVSTLFPNTEKVSHRNPSDLFTRQLSDQSQQQHEHEQQTNALYYNPQSRLVQMHKL